MLELASCPKEADPDKVYTYYIIKNLQYFLFYQISTEFIAGKLIAHHFGS